VLNTVEQTTGLSFLKALEKEREYPVTYPKCNDYTDNTDQVIPYQKSPCHLNSKYTNYSEKQSQEPTVK